MCALEKNVHIYLGLRPSSTSMLYDNILSTQNMPKLMGKKIITFLFAQNV